MFAINEMWFFSVITVVEVVWWLGKELQLPWEEKNMFGDMGFIIIFQFHFIGPLNDWRIWSPAI